ncbi:hypothetical protein GCM10009731_04550 [Streptomyces globosus]
MSTQEIAELLDTFPLDGDVLGVVVHEAFAEQVGEVNNQGPTAQVEYLAGGCADVHALRDLLATSPLGARTQAPSACGDAFHLCPGPWYLGRAGGASRRRPSSPVPCPTSPAVWPPTCRPRSPT